MFYVPVFIDNINIKITRYKLYGMSFILLILYLCNKKHINTLQRYIYSQYLF